MIAHLALLALLSGAATPSLTQTSVAVSVTGKTPAAVRAQLRSASEAVCRGEPENTLDAPGFEQCVGATYGAAMLQLRTLTKSRQTPIRSALLVR